MASPLDTVKPQVRALRAYSLVAERTRVKLNQNENPWDVPVEIKQETVRRINERAWSRYPDFTPLQFHETLAEFSGWKPEGVLAGNGSNELIQAVLMVTVGPGKRVLISEPTFALYRQITTVLGGEVLSVPLTPELTYDAEALLSAIKTTQPDVTIVCSPNNPTGCVMEASDLAKLLEASSGLVVVDEAYFEFSGQTAVPLLSRHPNLIVLRTFSKAMALAALRVGYLLGDPDLVREVGKALLPYNLNALSQTAAEVALEMFASNLAPLVQKICSERDRLYAELQNMPGLIPVRSRANFMVVRSQLEPRRVFDELLRRDILIRDVSKYPMLQECFRVSVGTPEENDLLIASLREILGAS
ncbi:MAG: histidinol-phosphate transaminase [Pyrinomonadaceae bacterium]|nr:histidinol-phosphate transaminase [Pyrinomonadaceae bacterium]